MTTSPGTVGRYLRGLLAIASAGAGVIHFAVAGGHFDVGVAHGLFFAVAAWLQLAWAATLMRGDPSNRLLAWGVVGNAVIIGTWALSRTVGVPVPPDAWTAEPVSFADALATGLEATVVVGGLAVLRRPVMARARVKPEIGGALLGVSLVAVAGLSTLALTPAFASDHHGDGGHAAGEEAAGHGHGDEAGEDPAATLASLAGDDVCDTDLNVASYFEELAALGPNHHEEGADDDHHGGAVETQSLEEFAAANGIEVDGGTLEQLTGALGGEPEVAIQGVEHGAGGPFAGLDGHGSPQHWTPMTDQAQCDQVRQELDAARDFAMAHPTVADAEAAGYRRATGYIRGIAAHYIHVGYLTDGAFDAAAPEMLLYDGDQPTSQMVGLSYARFSNDVLDPNEYGFTGGNDYPHNHEGLCVSGVGVVGSEETDPEECARRGGQNIGAQLQMIHAWVVPGCESPYGVFSAENPVLDWPLGQHTTEPRSAGCTNSEVELDSTPGMPAEVAQAAEEAAE